MYLFSECFPGELFEDNSNNIFWVGWDDDKPVCFCVLRPLESDKDSTFLSSSGVIPSYQGNGYQKRLIRVRLKYTKKHGYKKSITYTSKYNFKSYSSLQSCGFRLYEPDYKYVGDDYLYWIRYV